jgi:hypothetical protein
VNALVVHWSTPRSIVDALELEANVDRTKRRKAQRKLSMGRRAGREREPRDSPHIYVMAKRMIDSGVRSISRSESTANNTQINYRNMMLLLLAHENVWKNHISHWQPDRNRNRGADASMGTGCLIRNVPIYRHTIQ